MHDLWVFSYQVKRHEDHVCDSCGTAILGGLSLEGVPFCALCYQAEYQELGGGD